MGIFSSLGNIIKNAPQVALSAVPGIGSFMGQESANVANAQQAQQQMDFQREMSNTAHQREVTDLKAAGLNPMLSAMGGSGASTPSGAQATMGNSLAGMGELGPTAMSLISAKKDLELKDKAADKADIDISLAKDTNHKIVQEAEMARVEASHMQYMQKARQGSQNVPKYYKDMAKSEQEMAKANFSSARTTQMNEAVNQKYNSLDNTLKRTGAIADQIGKVITPGVKLDTHFNNSAKKTRSNYHKVDKTTGEILP